MIRLGIDYYPEHWPRKRWDIDVKMMQEAGITLARLGEFAWSKMEPRQGEFNFSWLEEAIELLFKHGIQVILGTPTATPPAWMIQAQPDILPWNDRGQITPFGNRRHYCFNNEAYWKHCDRIINEMAKRWAKDKRVAAWQTDNEFSGRCFCPRCEAAWRNWLKLKYGAIDKINEAWGTIFWSQEYSDFAQIPLAKHRMGSNNPGLHLDFLRFCSDSIVKFQKRQIQIIKAANPQALVTHNTMTMSGYHDVDLYDLTADLDFTSWDNYPMWTKDAVSPGANAMVADYARGLKRKNIWIMEQQSGAGGWRGFGRFPAPGEIRLWAYQSVARGADAVIFFRWRTALFGTEQYWHGILDHAGIANRRYAEVKQIGAEFKKIGSMLDNTTLRNEIAFLNTYDSRWAMDIQPGNEHLNYFGHFEKWYMPLFKRGVQADFINQNMPLDRYKLIIMPTLHLVSSDLAAKLNTYVRNGGTLVTTYRAGVKRDDNQVIDKPLPGMLAEVFGCEVEEYQNLDKMPEVKVSLKSGIAGKSKTVLSCIFNDILKATSGKVLAEYGSEHYAGKPAITINKYGKGSAVYVGFEGHEDFYTVLVPWMLKQARLDCPSTILPEKVESTVRENGNRQFRFLLNYNEKSIKVKAGKGGKEVLTGKKVGKELSLPRFGVAVIEEK